MIEPRSRLNADIRAEVKAELTDLIPHGYMGHLFDTIAEMLVIELKQNPGEIMALIFTQQMKIKDILEGNTPEGKICPCCLGSGFQKDTPDGTK